MIAITIQSIVSLFVFAAGVLCARSEPSAVRLLSPVKSFVRAFMGEDYQIPDITVGVGVALLGLLGLVNAGMMFLTQTTILVQ